MIQDAILKPVRHKKLPNNAMQPIAAPADGHVRILRNFLEDTNYE
jgi:hypothetical protein